MAVPSTGTPPAGYPGTGCARGGEVPDGVELDLRALDLPDHRVEALVAVLVAPSVMTTSAGGGAGRGTALEPLDDGVVQAGAALGRMASICATIWSRSPVKSPDRGTRSSRRKTGTRCRDGWNGRGNGRPPWPGRSCPLGHAGAAVQQDDQADGAFLAGEIHDLAGDVVSSRVKSSARRPPASCPRASVTRTPTVTSPTWTRRVSWPARPGDSTPPSTAQAASRRPRDPRCPP